MAAFMFIQSGTVKLFSFPIGMPGGGVPAALYCFVWLYFSAAGAGPWSLDALRGRR